VLNCNERLGKVFASAISSDLKPPQSAGPFKSDGGERADKFGTIFSAVLLERRAQANLLHKFEMRLDRCQTWGLTIPSVMILGECNETAQASSACSCAISIWSLVRYGENLAGDANGKKHQPGSNREAESTDLRVGGLPVVFSATALPTHSDETLVKSFARRRLKSSCGGIVCFFVVLKRGKCTWSEGGEVHRL